MWVLRVIFLILPSLTFAVTAERNLSHSPQKGHGDFRWGHASDFGLPSLPWNTLTSGLGYERLKEEARLRKEEERKGKLSSV